MATEQRLRTYLTRDEVTAILRAARKSRHGARNHAMILIARKNGHCRMHGGNAGRKPTHGRYTKVAIEERRKFRELIRLMRALISGAG